MRRYLRYYVAFVAVAIAAGCSLVNSVDDVKPADDGTFTGVDRPDAAAIVLQEASTPNGPGDGGSDGGNPSGQAISPLVVGGDVGTDAGSLAPVLTVLDSKTGIEYGTRESMWVAGIAHEGVRDLWYIFEAENYFVAAANETVKIHIRKLDPVTVAWTELAVFTTDAPIVYYDAIGVTNQRLSWVAPPATGQTLFRLLTLDTSNPSAPGLSSTTSLDQMPRGVNAVPNPNGPGGNLSLVNMGVTGTPDSGPPDCTAQTTDAGATVNSCVARIRRYVVAAGGLSPNGFATFGSTTAQGQPGYGTLFCTRTHAPDDITVLPGIGDLMGTQAIFATSYFDSTPDTALNTTFDMTVPIVKGVPAAPTTLRRAAIANKYRTVFMVEANSDTQLHAIPLGTPPAGVSDPTVITALQHSGQSVYYDPSSETVFAPFNQGGTASFTPFHIALQPGATFTVASAEAAKIALIPRNTSNDWNPPHDLRPNVLGIHQPIDPFGECQ